jgi:hypothetical protein
VKADFFYLKLNYIIIELPVGCSTKVSIMGKYFDINVNGPMVCEGSSTNICSNTFTINTFGYKPKIYSGLYDLVLLLQVNDLSAGNISLHISVRSNFSIKSIKA